MGWCIVLSYQWQKLGGNVLKMTDRSTKHGFPILVPRRTIQYNQKDRNGSPRLYILFISFQSSLWYRIMFLLLCCQLKWSRSFVAHKAVLLSTPMGVDYEVSVFDMEVQPLVTHNAAWPLCMSAICIDVVSNHLLFAHMPWALLAKMSWASVRCSHTGSWALSAQISWAVIR